MQLKLTYIILTIIPLLGIMGCMPSERFVYLPPLDYHLNKDLLKTNGYFYTEKTSQRYCKKEYNGSGYSGVDSTEYEDKYIRVLFLNTDGSAYHTGGLVSSGLSLSPNYDYYDHCDQIAEWNTYEKAHQYFQNNLNAGVFDYNNRGKANRGTYKIVDDSLITIQIYFTGLNYNLILSQFDGKIYNSSTIHLTSYKEYHPKYSKNIDELYKFKAFDTKPDSLSYILDNRKKFDK